ncbi:MAG: hypothetical protein ACLFTK_14760 [Anaerolineales bacterium]
MRKLTLLSLIIVSALVFGASVAWADDPDVLSPANDVPPFPIAVDVLGQEPPQPTACDAAIPSYLAAGGSARTTFLTSWGLVAAFPNYEDPNISLDQLIPQLLEFQITNQDLAHNLHATADIEQRLNDIGPADLLSITGPSVCVGDGSLFARFWPVAHNNQAGWAIETLHYADNIELGEAYYQLNADLNSVSQPGNRQSIVVDNAAVRLLQPVVTPTIETGNTVNVPQGTVIPCTGGAPTNLSVGTDAILTGYGYFRYSSPNPNFGIGGEVFGDDPNAIEWPETFPNNNPLQDYGQNAYNTIRFLPENGLRMGEVNDLDNFFNIPPADLLGGINIARVVEGPLCLVREYQGTLVDESDDVVIENSGNDTVETWWRIEMQNGELTGSAGWYFESAAVYAHWLYEEYNMADRLYHFYYMQPFNAGAMAGGGSCDDLLPGRLTVNTAAHTFAGLNLRDNPNGATIDQLAANTNLIINGEPVCMGENRWVPIRTDDGRTGWVAENDREFYYLVPGAATTTEEEPRQPDTTAPELPSEQAQPAPEIPSEQAEPAPQIPSQQAEPPREPDTNGNGGVNIQPIQINPTAVPGR